VFTTPDWDFDVVLGGATRTRDTNPQATKTQATIPMTKIDAVRKRIMANFITGQVIGVLADF